MLTHTLQKMVKQVLNTCCIISIKLNKHQPSNHQSTFALGGRGGGGGGQFSLNAKESLKQQHILFYHLSFDQHSQISVKKG